MDDLLPCPFCGSTHIRTSDAMYFDDDEETIKKMIAQVVAKETSNIAKNKDIVALIKKVIKENKDDIARLVADEINYL